MTNRQTDKLTFLGGEQGAGYSFRIATIERKLEVALTWVCFVVCASPFRVFNQEFNIFLINCGIFGDTFDGEFLDSENKH